VGEDDLTDSLIGLSRLLTGHQPLRATLTRIADFAVHAIPGAEGAGLTMLEDDRPQTVVATADFVQHVDDVQYGLGEGPCLLAVATGRTQVTGSLGGEARWPRFGPRVGRLGVNSALSIPLLLDGRVLGAMNVYARPRDAFDDRSVRVGEAYAVPAAVSVRNAQILAQSQRLAEQLQEALSSRAVIDQALGIVRSRTGCTEEEAMERLRHTSRTSGHKVSLVARNLVEEAVRGAHARSARPSGSGSS
jgi:GAF domain-containing protein